MPISPTPPSGANTSSPCGPAIRLLPCQRIADEHVTRRDGLPGSVGEAKNQAARLIERFKLARQLAIARPDADGLADAGGAREPVGADDGKARAAVPLRETDDHCGR